MRKGGNGWGVTILGGGKLWGREHRKHTHTHTRTHQRVWSSLFFPPHTHTHTTTTSISLLFPVSLSLSLSVVLPDFVVEFHLLLVSECGGAADITLASHYHLSHSLSSSLSNTHTHTKTLIAHTHTHSVVVYHQISSL